MKKKSYQKPLMVSEEFVPQEYVAACSPDISWQPKPNATPYSSDSHFWIDKNNNGILDTNEQINSNRYTCDNSGALPNGEKGQYVFEYPSKERLFAYKTKGNSIIVYKLDQIIIGNHS